jgi:hypothetical protein
MDPMSTATECLPHIDVEPGQGGAAAEAPTELTLAGSHRFSILATRRILAGVKRNAERS